MFTYITLALATVASVSGLAIPRDGKPATYGNWLEDYDQYHTRYLAIGCKGKQGTPFFETCCRPMNKDQVLEQARPAQCIPGATSTNVLVANPTGTVAATASPTATDNSDDGWCYEGDEDCECADDAELSSSAAPTPAPEQTQTGKPNIIVSSTAAPAPATTTQAATNNGNGEVIEGGFATYYFQNGVAGACGKVHSDDDMIAALTGKFYGDFSQTSNKCGKTIRVTRKSTGKSIDVIVADACPTCVTGGSVDLSTGAFNKLGKPEEGMFDIVYQFLN